MCLYAPRGETSQRRLMAYLCQRCVRHLHPIANESHIRRSVRNLADEEPLIDTQLRLYWKNYLVQCAMAALALLAILLVVDVVVRAVIVVAIASSAFIVFVVPHSRASTPRRVIGGHVVAVIVASAFSLLYLTPVGDLVADFHIVDDLIAVAGVGISILIMVSTNTEHAPAAGTALGLTIEGWAPSALFFVLLGAVMLSVAHSLLRPAPGQPVLAPRTPR